MTNPTALRISLNVDALSTGLIAALDTALTYTLTADTVTKQWGWTCSDGYSVDGDALIGQLHASTAYIRFSVYEQINTGVTGIAELTAISFT